MNHDYDPKKELITITDKERIVVSNMNLDDYRKLVSSIDIDSNFGLIPASKFSLDMEILRHQPQTANQNEFKKQFIETIKLGIDDFRAPYYMPKFNQFGDLIFSKSKGMESSIALNRCPIWWEEEAEKLLPKEGSRLGTPNQRKAFLGFMIQYLNEKKNFSLDQAWSAVCDDYIQDLLNTKEVECWMDPIKAFMITLSIDNGIKEFITFGNREFSSNYKSTFIPAYNGIKKLKYPYACYYNSVGWIVLNNS